MNEESKKNNDNNIVIILPREQEKADISESELRISDEKKDYKLRNKYTMLRPSQCQSRYLMTSVDNNYLQL